MRYVKKLEPIPFEAVPNHLWPERSTRSFQWSWSEVAEEIRKGGTIRIHISRTDGKNAEAALRKKGVNVSVKTSGTWIYIRLFPWNPEPMKSNDLVEVWDPEYRISSNMVIAGN